MLNATMLAPSIKRKYPLALTPVEETEAACKAALRKYDEITRSGKGGTFLFNPGKPVTIEVRPRTANQQFYAAVTSKAMIDFFTRRYDGPTLHRFLLAARDAEAGGHGTLAHKRVSKSGKISRTPKIPAPSEPLRLAASLLPCLFMLAANDVDSVEGFQELVELEVATHPERLLSIEPVRAALEKWEQPPVKDK
jgi:hypothetical protein